MMWESWTLFDSVDLSPCATFHRRFAASQCVPSRGTSWRGSGHVSVGDEIFILHTNTVTGHQTNRRNYDPQHWKLECAGEGLKGPWEEGVVGPWGEKIWEWVVLGVCDRTVVRFFLSLHRDRRVVVVREREEPPAQRVSLGGSLLRCIYHL